MVDRPFLVSPTLHLVKHLDGGTVCHCQLLPVRCERDPAWVVQILSNTAQKFTFGVVTVDMPGVVGAVTDQNIHTGAITANTSAVLYLVAVNGRPESKQRRDTSVDNVHFMLESTADHNSVVGAIAG